MGTPPPIEIASLGMWDTLILMGLALVVFGPRRLPEIGRQIGKLMYEFRKASNDFKFQMEEELRSSEEADRRKKEEERRQALALAAPPQPALNENAALAEDAAAIANVGAPSFDAGDSVNPSSPDTNTAASDEKIYPRIMPPSSGEQVAAARPNKMAAMLAADTHSGIGAESAPAVESQAAQEETAASKPEQAAHHG
jgi:sec-independent protein translocase protein TatB